MKKLAILLLHFYQRFLSFDTGLLRLLFPSIRTCRFTPSCSSYAIKAYEKYGFLKGSVFALKRVFKCHPFHPGGLDPLPR